MRLFRARYRSGDDFLQSYDGMLPLGGIFYPTRAAMPVGTAVLLEICFEGLRGNQILRGKVAYRRAGRYRMKLRAGLGIEFGAAETARRDFLLAVAKGEIVDMITRRHRRLPVTMFADWRIAQGRELHRSYVEDIGTGGAFLKTTEILPPGSDLIVEVTPPGSLRPLEIAARVAWVRHTPGEEGIGVEFRTRDAGGQRRLKELIRRLEFLEAENRISSREDRDDREDFSELS